MDADKKIHQKSSNALKILGMRVLTIFGIIWFVVGVIALPRSISLVVLTVGLLMFGYLMRITRKLKRISSSTKHHSKLSSAFWLTFGVECFFIIAGVILCNIFKRPELIPPLIALIVGLHFFPLSRVFNQSRYIAVGVGLSIGGIVLLIVGYSHSVSSLTLQAATGIISAIVLWGCALSYSLED